MPTKKKVEFVEELREKFTRCTITVATDYTGLGVNTMTELRRAMREKQIEYRVVKNTLTYLAADAAERPQIKEIVQGPTALAFGYEDPVDVAKALEEYIRVNRSVLAIRGAVLDGRALSPAEVTMLANLPPRAQLVAQLLGQTQAPLTGLLGRLQAPLYGLLGALNGTLTSFGSVLQQRVEQLKVQGEVG
jgi:large subunit ribosomal protein L10